MAWAGILFIAGDIYPAIRTYDLERDAGLINNNKMTEEMLQETIGTKGGGGMVGNLTDDLNRALWYGSTREKMKAGGEIFQDIIGYSQVSNLETEVQKVEESGNTAFTKEAVKPVSTVGSVILPRPTSEEIKKEIKIRGLDKNITGEKAKVNPIFSILRNPEREEISVPVGEDSALPHTSLLLASMLVASLVSFILTCTWCTWALPIPADGRKLKKEEEVELSLAA